MKETQCDACHKGPGTCQCQHPHFTNVEVTWALQTIRNCVDLEHVLKRVFTELNLDEFSKDLREVQVSTFEEDGAGPAYRGIHLMWPDGRNCHIAFTFQGGKEAVNVADRRAHNPGHSGHGR